MIKLINVIIKNVLAIYGDSFTEWYGDKDENISKLLANKYTNYEVCNFGILVHISQIILIVFKIH